MNTRAMLVYRGEGRRRVELITYLAVLDRYCHRPVGVPAALERMEAGLDVLVRSGFPERSAVEVFAAVHLHDRVRLPGGGPNAAGDRGYRGRTDPQGAALGLAALLDGLRGHQAERPGGDGAPRRRGAPPKRP